MEDLIVEFIEVAIHQILFHRDLYPRSVFSKRLLFDVPVMGCQHPAVCDFICDHLESLRQVLHLHGPDVKQFEMVVLDETKSFSVETYVFQLSIRDDSQSSEDFDFEQASIEFRHHLRSFLLKLISRLSEHAFLSNYTKKWTYTFRVHLTTDGEDFFSKDLNWCVGNKTTDSFVPKKIVPVHSISDPFQMNFYIEA